MSKKSKKDFLNINDYDRHKILGEVNKKEKKAISELKTETCETFVDLLVHRMGYKSWKDLDFYMVDWIVEESLRECPPVNVEIDKRDYKCYKKIIKLMKKKDKEARKEDLEHTYRGDMMVHTWDDDIVFWSDYKIRYSHSKNAFVYEKQKHNSQEKFEQQKQWDKQRCE